MNKKKILLLTGIGAGIEFLVVLVTGILGVVLKEVPLLAAINGYGNLFAVKELSAAGFVGLTLLGFDVLMFVLNLSFALAKKKPLLILPALCLFLAIAFIPLLLLLVGPSIDAGNATSELFGSVAALLVFNMFAIVLLAKPTKKIYCDHQERPVQVAKPVKQGVSEVEVRSIIKDYIELHEENMHSNMESQEVIQQEEVAVQPVEEPAPVEEEEPVEADDEDEEGEEGDEIEEVEVVDASGNLVKIKRRKKASFETRLKNSEYDIRHKYYDLRDYIKWYGLSNRISIPGDSFSYKRRKYAFITIVGKHIKFYIALDPDKYENSPIPVERAAAKKYVDTPCVLRIKSDLSYRRAKLLVDDLMKEIGLERPEGDEPKETQHPED